MRGIRLNNVFDLTLFKKFCHFLRFFYACLRGSAATAASGAVEIARAANEWENFVENCLKNLFHYVTQAVTLTSKGQQTCITVFVVHSKLKL